MTICVILAAGNSTRFGDYKQLYSLNGKPIINHSIDIFDKCVDEILIVTNSNCISKIKTNHKIIVSDNDSRLKSIQSSIDFIGDKYIDNIIIHDAARPFITTEYVNALIESTKNNHHSQYYLKLVNGLAKRTNNGWEIPNREDYIELCTPQCTEYDTFKWIFRNFIESNKECEILPLVSKLNKKSNLIEGHYKYLRKITTVDDI